MIEKLFEKELLANQKEIVDLVRGRWKKGIRPDGDIIGTYSWFSYELEKRTKNPLAGGNVDLIDTGDLEKGLLINSIGNSVFTIFSTDEKASKIASKYGLDVYGLTNKEITEILIETAIRVNKQIYNTIK